ncbi:hypothetical protein AB1N83_012963 [Pleurotus pulmonarius]
MQRQFCIARPLFRWSLPCTASIPARQFRPLHCLLARRAFTAKTAPRSGDALSKAHVPIKPLVGAVDYEGPLSNTFRRLKIFSVASLTLSTTLAPFIFIIESTLPTIARGALVCAALGTSGISTALVSWCGRPYVTTLSRLTPSENNGVEGLEMTTLTLTLRPRITRVYDTEFLAETDRPFAKWELRELIAYVKDKMDRAVPVQGQEETVAETFDGAGNVIGRWIVKWKYHTEGGRDYVNGECRAVGKVERYFNVHEELLH